MSSCLGGLAAIEMSHTLHSGNGELQVDFACFALSISPSFHAPQLETLQEAVPAGKLEEVQRLLG